MPNHMDMGVVSAPALGGGTTSTIFGKATAITGWHVLKVDGYSHTKDLRVGESINSSTFRIGEHNWHLGYFPSGFNDESADWISMFLHVEAPVAKEIKARFKFSLLDHAGDPRWRYTSKDCNFTTIYQSWGYHKFIRRAILETSYVKDDSFQIRCDVTILNELRVEDTTVAPLPASPATDLHRHLGELLASEVGGDVTFKVAGELITAHRYVLAARSSVFMAQFFGPMKEKTTECISIKDMEPRVFKAMLHFICTDWLQPQVYEDEDEEMAMAQHLLVAADRYDLPRLKVICEGMLSSCGSSIDTATVATTLLLAEQHGCKALKEACFKFLKPLDRLKAAKASDGFQHLMATCPSLVTELIDNVAP